MKNTCILSPATPVLQYPSGIFKQLCLNTPGGAGSFLCGGYWYGVAASPSGIIFFTHTKATPYVKQQTFPLRPGNPGTRRNANYPPAFTPGRTRYAPRFDAVATRIPAVFEAPKRQARTAPAEDGLKADYLPLYSSYFINLQCVSTVKR